MNSLRCGLGVKAEALDYREHLERTGPRAGLCNNNQKEGSYVWSEMMK